MDWIVTTKEIFNHEPDAARGRVMFVLGTARSAEALENVDFGPSVSRGRKVKVN